MSQVTWRAPDDLVERVRRAAARQGHSLNEYLTRLAEAAVDPEQEQDPARGLLRRVLEHVHTLWGRPVHLETVIDDEPARLHYNGEEHEED